MSRPGSGPAGARRRVPLLDIAALILAVHRWGWWALPVVGAVLTVARTLGALAARWTRATLVSVVPPVLVAAAVLVAWWWDR